MSLSERLNDDSHVYRDQWGNYIVDADTFFEVERMAAAAPELLAAAKWGLRFAEDGELGEVRETAIRELRAAITKATGKD